VFAAGLAAWALPEWEGDLPDDLAEGWRALLAFAAAAAASPPDPAGRRPKAVYQELRRLEAKVERLVARQIRDHTALMASLADAVAQETADGTFVPADFVLPTAEELAAAHPDSGQ
jgi:broad specificity phosphatase PhoE